MTLAAFITDNMEAILQEWEEFASTLASSHGLDKAALRDHAELMLRAVAVDMQTQQTEEQQRVKGRGEAVPATDADDTAAESHGDHRFHEGFGLQELVSEYRALRASVIRLWTQRAPANERTIDEITRFNEGIDQLLAESVMRFSKQLDRARELFMGVLGHDLRTHLQVILSSSAKLRLQSAPEQIDRYATYIQDSTQGILGMVEDLLDVARTRLGAQLPLDAAYMDGAKAAEEMLSLFRRLHPQCDLRFEQSGDLHGEWDSKRLAQLLANIMRNAIQHGDATRPITLRGEGAGEFVLWRLHNFGTPIPRPLLPHIFEPMRHGDGRGDATSLGLGLYIACTIATAHRGWITVESTAQDGTTFTVRLPKKIRTSSTYPDTHPR